MVNDAFQGTFEGRVALVTGGAAGIGKATALAFATAGARVMIADIKPERGQEVAAEIEAAGREARYRDCDVADATAVDKLITDTVAAFGRLDVAFNNAGIEGQMAPTGDCPIENFDRTIAINLRGVFLCMRRQIQQMRTQEPAMDDGRAKGVIVNMSSVAGRVGFGGLPAYVASKHGVLGLTKSAALENATEGIRVNAVCPGVIHTEMIDRITGKDEEVIAQFIGLEPMARMGTPDEIASAVLWLSSPGASFTTGESLAIDGGFVAR